VAMGRLADWAQLQGARRIALWLALTAAWAGLTLFLAANPERPRDADAPGRPRALAPRGVPTSGPGALGFGSSADEPANAPPEIVAALPEARRVASAFAVAYASWRHNESPEAAAARIARVVTPDLAARLATPDSGGTAGQQMLRQQGEYATAVAEAVQTQELSPDGVTLVVVVRQDLHTRGGMQTRRPSYAVRLVRGPTGSGWLVQDFTP
jgi:hypothetical protein